ncbi:hypothetical protein TSOC_012110, partial [Tetrabaena socialis]
GDRALPPGGGAPSLPRVQARHRGLPKGVPAAGVPVDRGRRGAGVGRVPGGAGAGAAAVPAAGAPADRVRGKHGGGGG